MAGNSRRRGAVRKAGSKKGAQVGSGGQRRRGLQGKGPTPKAEDRPYHPAGKRKAAEQRREQARPKNQRTRMQADHEVVAGRNAVLEAMRARITAGRLYLAVAADSDDRIREIVDLAAEGNVDVRQATRADLEQLTGTTSHQGVAIEVPEYSYADPQDLLAEASAAGPPLLIALDGITDPRNLGATLRSAGAFGADGLVVPARRSAGVTVAAWKVSAGAAARVPVARATNLVRTLQAYKKAGCFVVGLDGDGTTAIGELSLATEPLVLVLGSEGKGLSRLVAETCDQVVAIPIESAVESLNAGTAIGIALYEVARRRREG